VITKTRQTDMRTKTRYNVYSETDMEAVKSAITNLGLDPNETGRWRITSAADLVRWGMECLCDGLSEDEAERCLAEEVLAAKERIHGKPARPKCKNASEGRA